MPEFFRETRFTHFTQVKLDFTLVKCPSLLEVEKNIKKKEVHSLALARAIMGL
jgi:hypothetical protein